FQAEDGIRDGHVTGVQTCALPISVSFAHHCFAALALSLPSEVFPTELGSPAANVALYGRTRLFEEISPYPAEQIHILVFLPAFLATDGIDRTTDQCSPQYSVSAITVPFRLGEDNR